MAGTVSRFAAVTGSASGLGAALVRRLAADGTRVIGVDRRDADVVADLGEPEGRRLAVAAVLERCGGSLGAVVSCAGLGPYDEARAITRVNFFGAIFVLDGLREALARGREPAAVAISSVGAAVDALLLPDYLAACHAGDEERALELIDGRDGNTAYVNAKRALAQAVRRRAAAWGALGVRLNAVAPGKMETPMLDRLLADERHAPAIRALPVPLGRSAPAEEIAAAVAFLLGPDSRYVHGHVLFADGGVHALMAPDAM
jgi:NAD(P)-dependent dehydrogenase (short-subunit alcohol dehydrogenase family)